MYGMTKLFTHLLPGIKPDGSRNDGLHIYMSLFFISDKSFLHISLGEGIFTEPMVLHTKFTCLLKHAEHVKKASFLYYILFFLYMFDSMVNT